MPREIIFLVEEAPEGGYVARALRHSIFTEADSWNELEDAIWDSIRCHFDGEVSFWEEWDSLAKKISQAWKTEKSALEILAEIR